MQSVFDLKHAKSWNYPQIEPIKEGTFRLFSTPMYCIFLSFLSQDNVAVIFAIWPKISYFGVGRGGGLEFCRILPQIAHITEGTWLFCPLMYLVYIWPKHPKRWISPQVDPIIESTFSTFLRTTVVYICKHQKSWISSNCAYNRGHFFDFFTL